MRAPGPQEGEDDIPEPRRKDADQAVLAISGSSQINRRASAVTAPVATDIERLLGT